MKTHSNRGFTLVEVIVAVTLSLIILGGVMSTFIMFIRSSIRISNYDRMETQATRSLEILARDARMAQDIQTTDTPKLPAKDRKISKITLTVPDPTGGGTSQVTYEFSGTIFTRTVGGNTQTLITDIASGTGGFSAYNLSRDPVTLKPNPAANDYETNQIKITMTASPDTKGLYASTTKRIISARFVLRNR